jgi:transcriptional regulator with XRE-family HTH domain
MPTTLSIRRDRQFRPVHYIERHRYVAWLLAQGLTRSEIALVAGYSQCHVSRIASMRSTRSDVVRFLATQALSLLDRFEHLRREAIGFADDSSATDGL